MNEAVEAARRIVAWHRKEGDPISVPLDELVVARALLAAIEALNTPELHDFSAGVVSEAQHQRERWGVDGDAGKTAADWFWLVGYLAGKALTAANAGNTDKALHHCVSTAAALANWHAFMSGQHSRMRPGIESPFCEDCPPVGYPTDNTRCTPCPRRAALSSDGGCGEYKGD